MISNPQSDDWSRAQALFAAALQVPAAHRAAFLQLECPDDELLRAEVESLLANDGCDQALALTFEAAAAAILDDSIAGRRVGPYRIVSELGRGGMGAVYLAVRDDDVYRKQVAVKLVRRGMDTAAALERFRYERQILANLDHPFIARLLDGGATAEHAPFLVMEYIDGKPIDVYCRDAALSVEERCRLMLRVCDGVAYAHQNLVVHRDLKPSNILVTAEGTAKLLDFGVAKILDSGPDPVVTGLAQRALTPEYASPEHFLGRPATTATDVYSLGAVFYELLTGARAHALHADRADEWQRVICEQDVPRPRAVQPGLAADLENILLMALRKEPERRYFSVEQFASDIRRFLDKRPVMAREDSFAYRTGRYLARNRTPVAAAAVVAASLVAAAVISVGQARKADAERHRAEEHSRRAEQSNTEAEGQRKLAQIEARNAREEEQRSNQRLNQMVALANQSLFDVHAAIERLPGATPVRKELVGNTLSFLEHLARDAGSDDRLTMALAAAYLRVGDVQGFPNRGSYGDTAGALKTYARAQALLDPFMARAPRSPEAVNLWVDLQYSRATVLIDIGQSERAARLLTAALPFADGTRRATLHQGLTNALQYTKPDQALASGLKAIEELGTRLEREPANHTAQFGMSTVHSMVAMILKRRDQYGGAISHLHESARIRQELVGREPENPGYRRGLMLTYGQIAAMLEDPDYKAGRNLAGARAYYEKAAVIAREASRLDPQNRVAQYDVASVELRLGTGGLPGGSPEESLAQLNHSRVAFEGLLAAEPESIRYRRSLAMVYRYTAQRHRETGRSDEALAEYRQALAHAEAVLNAAPNDASTIRQAIHNEQAIAHLLAGRGDREAIAFAAAALARAKASASPDPRPELRNVVATAHLELARVEFQLERWEQARSAAALAAAEWKELLRATADPAWSEDQKRAESLIGECDRRMR